VTVVGPVTVIGDAGPVTLFNLNRLPVVVLETGVL
jgi:hypothetical protein